MMMMVMMNIIYDNEIYNLHLKHHHHLFNQFQSFTDVIHEAKPNRPSSHHSIIINLSKTISRQHQVKKIHTFHKC